MLIVSIIHREGTTQVYAKHKEMLQIGYVLAYSLTHLLTDSLTNLLTYLLTYLLTHLLTCSCATIRPERDTITSMKWSSV